MAASAVAEDRLVGEASSVHAARHGPSDPRPPGAAVYLTIGVLGTVAVISFGR
jgi:hypothetical protein